jgi:hypothetical protein
MESKAHARSMKRRIAPRHCHKRQKQQKSRFYLVEAITAAPHVRGECI